MSSSLDVGAGAICQGDVEMVDQRGIVIVLDGLVFGNRRVWKKVTCNGVMMKLWTSNVLSSSS